MSVELGMTGLYLKNMRIVVMTILLLISVPFSLEKRDRWTGLNRLESSSTMGRQNLFFSMYGRAFLWDDGANKKLPTMLPQMELGYGLNSFSHIAAGFQIMTTRPSFIYAKLALTTPNNKNIRFLGFGQILEVYKTLISEFPSNGLRTKNEGFTPDYFLLGSSDPVSFYRAITSVDIDVIRALSFLPLKFYLNAGVEWSFNSWMNQSIEAGADSLAGRGVTNYTKIPLAIGAELKTLATDFFVELESEAFFEHWKSLYYGVTEGKEDAEWVRYNFYSGGHKIVDVHILETPVFISAGGKLKYPNGMSLQGGFSWLLSQDFGAALGQCNKANNICNGGATDGFAPFYPQWRLFGRLTYPIRFKQTSAELYRTYLLRKNRIVRKVFDFDSHLKTLGDGIKKISVDDKDSEDVQKGKRDPEEQNADIN